MNEETKTRSTATTIVRTDPLRFKKGVDGTVILLQIQDISNTVLAMVRDELTIVIRVEF
jgi:hypothetical protein